MSLLQLLRILLIGRLCVHAVLWWQIALRLASKTHADGNTCSSSQC